MPNVINRPPIMKALPHVSTVAFVLHDFETDLGTYHFQLVAHTVYIHPTLEFLAQGLNLPVPAGEFGLKFLPDFLSDRIEFKLSMVSSAIFSSCVFHKTQL